MTVTVALRGTLKKYFGENNPRVIHAPEGSTCEDVLAIAGLDWTNIKNFGFVSVNNKRVMITDVIHDGDILKAFSKVFGG
jgi:hypothetical protein